MALILAKLLTVAIPVVTCVNVTFTSQPGDLTVREGNAFNLSCNVSVDGSTSNITLHYYWNKDGALFTNRSNLLSVTSADISHSGVYECVVSVTGATVTALEKHSRNATVTVIFSDMDSGPLIAVVVSVTAVGIILTIFLAAIGVYMCYQSTDGSVRGHRKHKRKRKHHSMPIPGRLSPSAPRHLSKGLRAKSKSLSQLLLHSNFPLDTTLHSSTNLLAGSQPTQVTDIEDPTALDYDLALDEDMFEHNSSHTDSTSDDKTTLFARGGRAKHRHKFLSKEGTVSEQREARRRASEGTLVVPEAMGTSRKSILKESKSFNDDLHNQRRGSAVSDMSSDVTQSDENSLHLGKSVRFNVSGDDWAEDSGVQTGNSTPHNTPYPNFNRCASEPDTLGCHFNNSERRGSAPGDLAPNVTVSTEIQQENARHEERKGNHSGEIDEGLVTGSEEWTQQEREFNFKEAQAERLFKGVFSKASTDDPDKSAQVTTKQETRGELEPKSSGIVTRVAQLFSVPQKQTEGSFIRGPSSLTMTSQSAVISKLKVSEMKEKFLQREEQRRMDEFSKTVREEGRRQSLSKLVQERAEIFRERSTPYTDVGLGMDSLKRARQRKETTPKESEPHKTEKTSNVKNLSEKAALSTTKVEPTENHTQRASDKPIISSDPIMIPVFSGPSGLSNWVPSCLRDTVITPYHAYGDEQMNENQESDDSDDGDIIMEPLEPAIGRNLIGSGAVASITSFGEVASFGKSWLQSGKPFGSKIPPLLSKPGENEISPYNEAILLQHGHAVRIGAIKRLSVIPEETASACSSMTDMYTN